jgi:RNA recognition motif-containing protein
MKEMESIIKNVIDFTNDTKFLGLPLFIDANNTNTDYMFKMHFRAYGKLSLIKVTIHIDILKEIINSNFTIIERALYGKSLPIIATEAIILFIYNLTKFKALTVNTEQDLYNEFQALSEIKSISNSMVEIRLRRRRFLRRLRNNIIKECYQNLDKFTYPYIRHSYIVNKRRHQILIIFIEAIYNDIKEVIGASNLKD